MAHPMTGVVEKAFATINLLQNRKFITVYDLADELCISRSTAHRYLTIATIVLPVYVINEEESFRNRERMKYALIKD